MNTAEDQDSGFATYGGAPENDRARAYADFIELLAAIKNEPARSLRPPSGAAKPWPAVADWR
jgi:hypothetical protein